VHQILLIEFKRIFNNKNKYILLIFLLLSFYFVYSGVIGYNSFQKEKEIFSDYEELKVKQYVNYEQYGALGLRVLYQVSPINVFFDSSYFLKPIESNVDTSSILKIHTPNKGKSIFGGIGYFRGFADFILFFGSLFMLYMGLTSFKSLSYIRFLKNYKYIFYSIIGRLLLLGCFFCALFVVMFFYVKANGIPFSGLETKIFFMFLLFMVVLLSFFFVSGLMISSFKIRDKTILYTFTLLFWIIFIILIPEVSNKYISHKSNHLQSNEKVNLDKLQILMGFERKVKDFFSNMKIEDQEEKMRVFKQIVAKFQNENYNNIKRLESDFLMEVKEMIAYFEKQSMIFPTTYLSFLQGEISGKGFYNYIRFIEYIMDMREDFLNFYIRKRTGPNQKIDETFIKDNANIFLSKSHIPATYYTGLGMLLVYFLVFLYVSNYNIRRQLNIKASDEKHDYEFEKGNTYFVLCKDQQHQDELFNSYKEKENAICINNIDANDIDIGLDTSSMVEYFSKIHNVKKEKSLKNLSILGIENIDEINKKHISPEIIKKVYCSIYFSTDKGIIVLNDFIKEATRKFEQQFLELLDQTASLGKIVVYLCNEINTAPSTLNDSKNRKTIKIYTTDPKKISLR
jgi:hypothetical protein